MNAKLGALFAALFLLLSNGVASAAVFDVSGTVPYLGGGFDTFTGSFDAFGGPSGADITLSGNNIPGGKVVLGEVVSVADFRGLRTISVEGLDKVDGLDFLLSFSFFFSGSLKQSSVPIIDPTEFVLSDFCYKGKCTQTETPFGSFGSGLISIDPTPLPATLPLFIGGLGLLGLTGLRKRRKKVSALNPA
jgi:hypothetical protein